MPEGRAWRGLENILEYRVGEPCLAVYEGGAGSNTELVKSEIIINGKLKGAISAHLRAAFENSPLILSKENVIELSSFLWLYISGSRVENAVSLAHSYLEALANCKTAERQNQVSSSSEAKLSELEKNITQTLEAYTIDSARIRAKKNNLVVEIENERKKLGEMIRNREESIEKIDKELIYLDSLDRKPLYARIFQAIFQAIKIYKRPNREKLVQEKNELKNEIKAFRENYLRKDQVIAMLKAQDLGKIIEERKKRREDWNKNLANQEFEKAYEQYVQKLNPKKGDSLTDAIKAIGNNIVNPSIQGITQLAERVIQASAAAGNGNNVSQAPRLSREEEIEILYKAISNGEINDIIPVSNRYNVDIRDDAKRAGIIAKIGPERWNEIIEEFRNGKKQVVYMV